MPNNDGGACAGAWASTSLPRLRVLVCATALDAPYAITSLAHAMVALLPLLHAVDATLSRTSARHGTPPCLVSPKGKASGTSGAARENFNAGSDPAIGWTSPLPAVRMRAAMLVSAVVATCRGRRRRGAIREDVLADELHVGVGSAVNFLNPTVSEWHQYLQCTRTRTNNCDDAFVRCRRLAG